MMYPTVKSLLSIGVLLLILSFTTKEDDFLEKVIDSLKREIVQNPVEKVFIHTDKPYYLSGEKIWLKAYLVTGSTHIPSQLSNVVYVDLMSSENKVIQNLILFAESGSASGTIALPDSVASGHYVLRAYTKWMQNFSCDYYYHQDIKIWNLFEDRSHKSSDSSATQDKIDFQFFPEGGNFISGISSKIAFKAITSEGLGAIVKGKIVGRNGQEVTTFQSNSLGMGFFKIVGDQSEAYRAVLEEPYSLTFNLPVVRPHGISFSITNDKARQDLIAKVQANLTQPAGTIYLVGQTRGVLCFAAKMNMQGSYLNTKIEKQKFPTGVAQFTLFDHAGKPIAERLVYIDNGEEALVKFASDKLIYKPREKVSMTIEVTNLHGEPLQADLSLSVSDSQRILIDDNDLNVISFLNLTSELKGNIESPGYYLDPRNSDRHEALEALMLTQGWRRFNWEEILADQSPDKQWTPEKGFSMRGKLVDKYNGKPSADGKITLMGTPNGDILITRSRADGSFLFKDLLIYDTSKITLLAENKRGNKGIVKVELDTLPSTINCTFNHEELKGTITDFESGFIKEGLRQREINAAYNSEEKTVMLETLEIKDTRLERTSDKIYGSGTKSIVAADVMGSSNFVNPLQFLQGTMAGVLVTTVGTEFAVQLHGDGTPLILLDNVPISMESLNMVPAQTIESIEVYKEWDASIFGARGAGGVIAFYTKRGSNNTRPSSSEGNFQVRKIGYQVPKEFYSPKYDVARPEHVKPDERIVLFWQPNIKTNEQGKATIEFYNHDLESSITGILQGITSNGIPLYFKIQYQTAK